MALPEELVEEVLLRFPPAEPVSLARAAIVCKEWYGIVYAPRFRGRFLEFHRAPPVIGVLLNFSDQHGSYVSRLVPTSAACPPQDDYVGWRALDARHGRVLLGGMRSLTFGSEEAGRHLQVWDPISYGVTALPPVLGDCNAAVVCAAGDACDHRECHGGPFVVVALGTGIEAMWLCVYSSEDDFWSEPIYISPAPQYGVVRQPAALVGNTLYFAIDVSRRTLSNRSTFYLLGSRSWCFIYLKNSSC